MCVDDSLGNLDTVSIASAVIKQIGEFKYYAVRSSSITEDTEESAAAGQFKTLLGVTKESLAAALQEVGASLPKLSSQEEPHGVVIQPFDLRRRQRIWRNVHPRGTLDGELRTGFV